MKREWLFIKLYLYALATRWFLGKPKVPEGIAGVLLFRFFDPQYPERRHGVVAFPVPWGESLNSFSKYLFGPFGDENDIDLNGKHLYGRDTWGPIKDTQLKDNPELVDVKKRYPNHTIVLAGVRMFCGHFVWPLRAGRFILVRIG